MRPATPWSITRRCHPGSKIARRACAACTWPPSPLSSGAYLRRRGDYCQGCAYDYRQRTGERAGPFNALYWDFFARHAPALANNHRLGMVYRQWRKMPEFQQTALRDQAQQLRQLLETL